MKNMNEQGRSMVEMLGVLAIIGVLSAGGLAGYSKAMFKHKMNTAIDQITMIVTNIRTLYGTQGDYNGLNNGMAIKAGIVPAAMYDTSNPGSGSAASLTNPFKGGMKISTDAAVSGGTSNTAFVIALSNLPSEACVQIATSDFGTGAGSGFIGSNASSSGYATVTRYVNDSKEGDPMSLTEAINACTGTGTTNSVALKFY